MWAGCSIYVLVVVVEMFVLMEGRLDTVLVVCLLYLLFLLLGTFLFLLLGTWTVSVSFEMERGFSDSKKKLFSPVHCTR